MIDEGDVVMLRPSLVAETESCVARARSRLRRCLRRVGVLESERGLFLPDERGWGVEEPPWLVAARLVGSRLPVVRLGFACGQLVSAPGIVRGCLYLYRGGGSSLDDCAEDVVLHQAFRDHCKGIDVRGVSSHAPWLRLHSVVEGELEHRLYSDRELQLAKALGLPTFRSEGRWFYERLIVVIDAGRIARVIYPVNNAGCVAEATAWLRSQGNSNGQGGRCW